MSNPEPQRPEDLRSVQSESVSSAGEEPSKGPNLVLLYSILALALIVAIGIAVFIVLPFYHRR